ncbi:MULTISPECIES: glucose 1-dehydrogenase [unclassified Mycobacterium]|uniref:SDR family NAD(P)-dependent oxidoreductase n=1 Tax=unclassified Mycobacterium TaxID=2642494 RepID=UPI00056BE443|nr:MULTISPECIES: glucose 1-dehydrogenase [unclassified Mycobacterium]SEA62215.1 gluconate 5-dehydrogenase [Mycobacterium sp. 283mftsu]
MPAPTFDLTGQVALVTGAGSGLGRQCAVVLSQAGATVACADRDMATAAATAEIVSSAGGKAVSVELDVTDASRVDCVVEQISESLDGLDILVNNAGIGDPRNVPLHRVRTEDWHRVLAVNLDGVFFCSRAALRIMVASGSGKIINVASMFGLAGSRTSPIPAYAAAKGAVVNLTREMGLQYAAAGIQVNALCPGYVRTGLSSGVFDDPTFAARMSATVPMGRIAEAPDMSGALLLLASPASDYMTGQVLVVDGGYTAG